MSEENDRCPKCGFTFIYVGANSVECGIDPGCENFTETQAAEVERLLEEMYPSFTGKEEEGFYAEEDAGQPIQQPQIDLDYDDLVDTAPMGSKPLNP